LFMVLESANDVEVASVSVPAVDAHAGRSVAAEIAFALNALPQRQREVFCLVRCDELSHAVVAERLGISRKAVEKTMAKVLRTLRRALAHLSAPGGATSLSGIYGGKSVVRQCLSMA
jgi:DNA-directed RNA polymerase specialized sigma24 family protein